MEEMFLRFKGAFKSWGEAETSGAEAAGMEEGDHIVAVGEETIDSYSDIRIALLDRRPGEKLPVGVIRERLLPADKCLTFQVELH